MNIEIASDLHILRIIPKRTLLLSPKKFALQTEAIVSKDMWLIFTENFDNIMVILELGLESEFYVIRQSKTSLLTTNNEDLFIIMKFVVKWKDKIFIE